MLVTVENVTNTVGLPSRTINLYDTYTTLGSGPPATVATGGNRVDALPYPFDWVGLSQYHDGYNNNGLAAGSSIQLPMHPRDFRYRAVPGLPTDAGQDFQALVQAGIITVAITTESHVRDVEELAFVAI